MALQFTSSSCTDVGKVRQQNEDAFLDRPECALWAVADGMGGHSGGHLASAMIVDRLRQLQTGERLSRVVDQVESALENVNGALRQLAAQREAATIGSTVAAVMARGHHAVIAWAGDSRVYRIRGETLTQLTQDHALVADLLDRGVLTEEQAAGHPHSNLVTRAVGAGDGLKLDMDIVELEPGDLLVLCTDGLDKEVSRPEILSTAMEAGAVDLAPTLVELALSRGARDNVTVVTVTVHEDADDDDGVPDLEPEDEDSEDTLPGFTAGTRSDA